MKTFNLNNLERTNLLLQIGEKTYTDDFFTLSGVTSFSKGAASTTSGSVSIIGDYNDFVNVSNNKKAILLIQTDLITQVFLTFHIQKPYTYDGEHIVVNLDTIPDKDTLGYTDSYGRQLPYCFGKPFVTPVAISQQLKGVILEDQYVLSLQDINNILEAYLSCQESFSEAIVTGMPNNNDSKLQNIKYYNDLIVSLIDRVRHTPASVSILENFFSLIYWRGSSNKIFLGDVSASQEADQAVDDAITSYTLAVNSNEPETTLQTLLQNIAIARENASKKLYYSNTGMLPPLSLHSILNTWDTHEVDYNVSHSYRNNISSIGDNHHRYSNLFTGSTNVSISAIKAQVLNWINQLTQLPTTFKIDLGDYVGAACLNINGLTVTGDYANKVFTVTGRGYEQTLWEVEPSADAYKVSISSTSEKSVDVSLNPEIPNELKTASGNLYINGQVRDLNGKYLLVTQSFIDGGRISTFRFPAYVIAQDGEILTLDSLPFINITNCASSNSSKTLYNVGTTQFSGILRQGTVLGVADSLEALAFVGNQVLYQQSYGYNLPQQQPVQAPFYWVHDIPTGGTEVESKLIYAREWSSVFGQGDYKSVTYRNPSYPVTNPVDVTESDGTVVTLGQEITLFGAHQKVGSKSSYVYSFNGGSFVWEIKSGQEVPLAGNFFDIFIVDCRPNILVTAVKSKIGEQYTLVPSEYYTVDYSYEYDGIVCTAIYFVTPLTKRFENFSNDIIVFVDTGVYTPSAMASSIISTLGLTLEAQNTLPDLLPSFVEYGYTDILEVVNKLFEQTNCGWFISNNVLKVKYLLTNTPTAQKSIDFDNLETYIIKSADVVNLFNNTLFSWETLDYLDGKAIVKLAVQEPSLVTNSKKDVEIYQDKVQSLTFAKFFIHRNSRNWYTVEINGFIDSAHLEPYDIVSITLGDISVLGEVQTVDFNHLTSEVKIEILTSAGTGESLWNIGEDIVIASVQRTYGHVSSCNAGLIDYYD